MAYPPRRARSSLSSPFVSSRRSGRPGQVRADFTSGICGRTLSHGYTLCQSRTKPAGHRGYRHMRRSRERILTTHVGSLPRPAELDDAVTQRPANERAYGAVLERAVVDVVKKQVELGLDIVNDGEFGKSSWQGYLSERVGGFEARPVPSGAQVLTGKDFQDFAEYYAQATRAGTLWYMPDGRLRTPLAPVQWVCTGPITYTGHSALQRDIDNFKAALKEAQVTEAFLPVAAPASVEPGRVNEHYPSQEAFVYALAEALKVEYDTIVKAGLLLQWEDGFIPHKYI